MAIDGPLQIKGCAGDMDISLEILGLDQDGCKNLTKAENKEYLECISSSFDDDKRSQLPSFTRLCRCSWDGCNGLPTMELLQNKDLHIQSNAAAEIRMTLAKCPFSNNLNQSFILIILLQSLNKYLEFF